MNTDNINSADVVAATEVLNHPLPEHVDAKVDLFKRSINCTGTNGEYFSAGARYGFNLALSVLGFDVTSDKVQQELGELLAEEEPTLKIMLPANPSFLADNVEIVERSITNDTDTTLQIEAGTLLAEDPANPGGVQPVEAPVEAPVIDAAEAPISSADADAVTAVSQS